MNDGPNWFHPKRYGMGSGLPSAWQGWVVLLVFLLIVTGTAFMFAEEQPIIFFAIILPVTAIFMLIAAKTTPGGWKWRWGKDVK